MPLWEKFKSMLLSVVEAQAYTTGVYAPEDFLEDEADPAAPAAPEEKE